MEQNLAILIADLSGYTALTEVHGAAMAADTIDTYLEIVNTSLVGSSRLQERVGDEVLLVSDNADALLATAVLLLQKAHSQPGFLQLHGALHFGPVLQRSNSFFGTTLNVASRMASMAVAGTIVCSTNFIDALDNKDVLSFQTKGTFHLKNVRDEKEIIELVLDKPNAFYTDPVCRMLVNVAPGNFAHPYKAGIYFCSQTCLDRYLQSEAKA
jgi:class 3 adenylate cyclase/YHS domain-containing protein